MKKTDTIYVSKHTNGSGKWLPGRGKKAVIHNGSQSKSDSKSSEKRRSSILKTFMVARADHSKDHETLSKALREVSGSIGVSLIGSGTDNQDFQARFSQNLPSNVQVIFFGEQANPLRIVASTDVVLLISNFEAFPLSILEAFALRKPVIASDVGGISEMFDNDSLLIPPKDVMKLVDSINCFLSLPQAELVRIGEQNRSKFDESFSAETMIKKIEDFYGQ